MTPRAWAVLAGALAALVAASVFWLAPAGREESALALAADGVGPLRLGRAYDEAATAARAVAPRSAFAGVGCGGLDEIRYSGELADLPVTVMAMAEDGVLVEVEVSLDSPLRADDEAGCVALRNRLAAPFVALFGDSADERVLRKPVSIEHRAHHGPVELIARWFPTGNSCYVTALYRRAQEDELKPARTPAR